MAYSSTNPPQVLVPGMGSAPSLWVYKSTHTSTEAANSGFFTNGAALGMKAADLVLVVNSTSGVAYLAGVVSVTASSAASLVGSTGA